MEARLMIMLMQMMMMMMIALFLGGAHAIEEPKTMSEEENMEMETQLKVINKPPIKSFQTEHGDILDCIHIYKQHAFDHPLLKDHKIQMRPKRILKEMMRDKSSMKTKPPRYLPKNIRCPRGSVLIKRTTKEDLIMAKETKSLGLNRPTSSHLQKNPVDDANDGKKNGWGVVEYNKHNFGAKAIMNVWNPSVSPTQFSEASIWIENGPTEKINIIQAGWRSEKYIGCSNYLCPGFVQVSREISLGIALQSSTYGGTQQEIEIGILHDGEWWLRFNNKFIGYWPQKLFFYMYGGANFVFWGGQVQSPPNEPSPAMGSGHFPEEGNIGKASYFKQMQIWDNVHLVYLDEKYLILKANRPQCYHAKIVDDPACPFPPDFFYGGPGQFKL